MSEPPNVYTFRISMSARQVEQAESALLEAGIDLHPFQNLMAADYNSEPDLHFGAEAPQLVQAINQFLTDTNNTPHFQENIRDWKLSQLDQFLHLATMNFNYQDHQVVRAWWYEKGLTWAAIIAEYPDLPTQPAIPPERQSKTRPTEPVPETSTQPTGPFQASHVPNRSQVYETVHKMFHSTLYKQGVKSADCPRCNTLQERWANSPAGKPSRTRNPRH